ncbi:hypothetical protein [Flagellimonas sp.]|uniref:hypothetical protein n=1 Tax=Flagellimonas sp. TaxID=2058762 RepID=UPI003BAFD96D
MKKSILKEVEEQVQSILSKNWNGMSTEQRKYLEENVRFIAMAWGKEKQRSDELDAKIRISVMKAAEVEQDLQDSKIISLKRYTGIELTEREDELVEKYIK